MGRVATHRTETEGSEGAIKIEAHPSQLFEHKSVDLGSKSISRQDLASFREVSTFRSSNRNQHPLYKS